jgi:uncharacterized RDD family membrane protein YckC
MSMPREGWYLDPQGTPGVNRWWSGTQWTDDTQIAPPPPHVRERPVGPAFAGYGVRLGGWLLDFVIVTAVSIPLLIPFGGAFHESTATNGAGTSHSVHFGVHGFGLLIQAALVLLYGTLFIGSRRGQTPGMMIVGIRCVAKDTATGSISYARAFLRAFVEYILAVAFFIPWVVDMLFPLWDGQKQTIHDKAGGSLVIDRVSG